MAFRCQAPADASFISETPLQQEYISSGPSEASEGLRRGKVTLEKERFQRYGSEILWRVGAADSSCLLCAGGPEGAGLGRGGARRGRGSSFLRAAVRAAGPRGDPVLAPTSAFSGTVSTPAGRGAPASGSKGRRPRGKEVRETTAPRESRQVDAWPQGFRAGSAGCRARRAVRR